MNWSKSAISMAVVFGLSACGGGGGGDTGGNGGDPSYEYQAYACDADIYEKAKELRIYQVMTEAFIDGDSSHDYNAGYGTSHHKGDLQGIIDSLDYIQSLGMNAVWMTPIFDSEGNGQLDATGYFTRNYFAIDPNFGTMEQARTLVNEAHARGMYVFFDGVFGHHKGNVTPSPNGLTPSGSDNPVSYPGTDNDTLEFYKEVATYWITELGIDGWRLDQAYQVPVGAWGEIRKSVEDASKATTYTMNGETVNPMGYLVAEIWRGESEIADQAYGTAEQPGLCSAFDFPGRYRIVQSYAVEESGGNNHSAGNLASVFSTHSAYPDHAVPNGFISNHDLVRLGDLQQRGNIAESEYWDRHKAANAFLAAYSGPITFYYGEEIGDEVPGFADQEDNTTCAAVGLCDDHVARNSGKVEGLPTGARTNGEIFAANTEQADLRDYISTLMQIRSENPALYKGERTAIVTDEAIDVYFDHKLSGDNVVLFLANTSTSAKTVTVSDTQIGSNGDLKDLVSDDIIPQTSGEYEITLKALESRFLKVVDPSPEGPDTGGIVGEGELADCTLPDSSEIGPIGEDVFARGSHNGWAAVDSHKLSYKGNNLYQLVFDEPSDTAFGFKYAVAEWSDDSTKRFEVSTPSQTVVLGTTLPVSRIEGSGKEMNVTIPEAGKYVYSLKIDNEDPVSAAGTMMVSKCE